MRVAQFRDSVGVNTHFNYTDGGYVEWRKVIGAVKYLGLVNVRDAVPRQGVQGQWALEEAAKAGLKFNFVIGGPPPEDAVSGLIAFYVRYPYSVVSVEGPNEVDMYPLTFGSLRDVRGQGFPATIAYMSAVRRILSGSPLKAIPLIAPSSIGPTKIVESGDVDGGNLHPYPQANESMLPKMPGELRNQERMIGPGKPVYITEMGYNDLRITPDLRAQQTLKWLVANVRYGAGHSYVYELLDAYPDPGGDTYEKHWGLFDRQFAPKPVAKAIHNLMWILGDDRGREGSTLPVRFEGASGGDMLALGRTDGRTLVLLWRDGAGPAQKAQLRLAGPLNYKLYNPREGVAPVGSGKAESIQFDLGADLMVAEIWP